MAPVTPVGEPQQVVAGDSWTWKLTLADYPVSEGWTLSYGIAGALALDWQGAWVTNDGNATWTVLIPASATAIIQSAGAYQWARIMTGSGTYAGQRRTLYVGTFDVLLDFAKATAGAAQSVEERLLVAIEAVLEGRITADIEQYMIAGRSVVKTPVADLLKHHARLKAIVWRQKHPDQIGMPVYAGFSSTWGDVAPWSKETSRWPWIGGT